MTPASRSVYWHYPSLLHSSLSKQNTSYEAAIGFRFNYFLSKPANMQTLKYTQRLDTAEMSKLLHSLFQPAYKLNTQQQINWMVSITPFLRHNSEIKSDETSINSQLWAKINPHTHTHINIK